MPWYEGFTRELLEGGEHTRIGYSASHELIRDHFASRFRDGASRHGYFIHFFPTVVRESKCN
jgi:hypothetical protein